MVDNDPLPGRCVVHDDARVLKAADDVEVQEGDVVEDAVPQLVGEAPIDVFSGVLVAVDQDLGEGAVADGGSETTNQVRRCRWGRRRRCREPRAIA